MRPFRTFETVATETLASAATSESVARLGDTAAAFSMGLMLAAAAPRARPVPRDG